MPYVRYSAAPYPALHITDVRQCGALQAGGAVELRGTDERELVEVAIALRIGGTPLAIDVNCAGRPQRLGLSWTTPTYGGLRPWFLCDCGRRVGVLYKHRRQLRCRYCWRFRYPSELDNTRSRILRRGARARARLTWPEWEAIPQKPKWMQWRTYGRLVRRVLADTNAARLMRYGMLSRAERRLPTALFSARVPTNIEELKQWYRSIMRGERKRAVSTRNHAAANQIHESWRV